MNYILFDDKNVRQNLLPLTFTRPIADIRFGITTMRQKWENILNKKTSSLTEDYLSIKYPIHKTDENILINSSIVPNEEILKKITQLQLNEAIITNEKIIAVKVNEKNLYDFENINLKKIEVKSDLTEINHLWDLFHELDKMINEDFKIITKNRKSQEISTTNNIIGNNPIFIEEGAIVEFAYLNTTAGPIYVGKDAEIMEGSIIRGPFAIGEHSVIKAGAKIYGPTSIGPHSKIGGEVSNSLILGYSNKAHDGFIGNSVLGEWCNLGADTNCSNLKNTYDNVKIWDYKNQSFVDTKLQFCGLIMGDHSKAGINTMFNTGTVVGVNANIFGTGFPRQFVKSFSWGGSAGYMKYNLEKAIKVAEKVYERRSLVFNDIEKNIFSHIYKITE